MLYILAIHDIMAIYYTLTVVTLLEQSTRIILNPYKTPVLPYFDEWAANIVDVYLSYFVIFWNDSDYSIQKRYLTTINSFLLLWDSAFLNIIKTVLTATKKWLTHGDKQGRYFRGVRFHIAGRHSCVPLLDKVVPMKGQIICGYWFYFCLLLYLLSSQQPGWISTLFSHF